MDNQHKKISGYRDLSQEEINAMNGVKYLEAQFNGMVDFLKTLPGVDQRQVALAATQGEGAFMHAVRAIARPERQVAEFAPFAANEAIVPVEEGEKSEGTATGADFADLVGNEAEKEGPKEVQQLVVGDALLQIPGDEELEALEDTPVKDLALAHGIEYVDRRDALDKLKIKRVAISGEPNPV